MTIGEPKVHTLRVMRVDSAVSGSEIQPRPSMPKSPRPSLNRPSVPKTVRHRTAMATLAPRSEGR